MQTLPISNIDKNSFRCFIDGSEQILTGSFTNLEDVLLDIMAHQIPDTHNIWSVSLNGEHFSETETVKAKLVTLDTIRSLEISTKGEKDILMQFLDSSSETCDILIQSAFKIAELFKTGDDKIANAYYLEFLNAFQNFCSMVQHNLTNMDSDLHNISFKYISIKIDAEELENIFTDMIAAQEKMDWILLSDKLENDIAPFLKAYSYILPIIKMQVKE
ncbi:MAG: hypothetical protein K9L30_04115 [Desulfobacterales bacterium]|nr:hypothetical protein [Desulfobacterales bacterium]